MQQHLGQPPKTRMTVGKAWKLTGTTRVGGTLHAAMTQLYVLTSTGTPAAAMTCAVSRAHLTDLARCAHLYPRGDSVWYTANDTPALSDLISTSLMQLCKYKLQIIHKGIWLYKHTKCRHVLYHMHSAKQSVVTIATNTQCASNLVHIAQSRGNQR